MFHVQDFKLWLTESPTSKYFQELYPDTSIHAGFLEQFQEVASNSVAAQPPSCAALQLSVCVVKRASRLFSFIILCVWCRAIWRP